MISRRTRFIVIAIISTILMGMTTSPMRGKSSAAAPYMQENFKSLVDDIAKQHNIAFIIEALPVKNIVSSGISIRFQNEQSLSVKLDLLCKEFGYEWEKQNNTAKPILILLRKQYSLSYDVPGVTIEECVESIRDASRILSVFSDGPNSKKSSPVLNCIRSFSQSQLSDLRNGISMRDLSQIQRDRFTSIAKWMYIENRIRNLETCEYSLTHTDDLFVFGQKRTDGSLNINVSMKDDFGEIKVPIRAYSPGLLAVAAPDNSTLPNVDHFTHSAHPTVRELASTLKVNRLDIQPCLYEKPLLCINTGNVPPSRIIYGLASIYDLRAIQDRPGEWRIERRRVQKVKEIENIYPAIKRAMPSPLVRAFVPTLGWARRKEVQRKLSDKSKSLAGRSVSRITEADRKEIRDLLREIHMSSQTIPIRPNQVANECVRRLERIYLSKTGGIVDKKLRLVDLGREARQDFAVLILAGFFDSGEFASHESPPYYISNFDNCVAFGDVQNRDIWVGIGVRDKSGKIQPLIRMGVQTKK